MNNPIYIEDRCLPSSARAAQQRRVVFTVHRDGSGSVSIYYGAKKRTEVALNASDWRELDGLIQARCAGGGVSAVPAEGEENR